MIETLQQMSALILVGILWRVFRPGGLSADQTRLVLTNTVYFVFLPALALSVLWQTKIDSSAIRVAIVTAAAVLVSGVSVWAVFRVIKIPRQKLGAMILATAFPNVLYMGLPVLEQTLGPWSRAVAMQMDLFACEPLLFTLGVLVARHYGGAATGTSMFIKPLLQVPTLWAAAAAIFLNANQVDISPWTQSFLNLLTPAVVPLMLISLGLSLSWKAVNRGAFLIIAVVVVIKLAAMPLFAWWLGRGLGLAGDRLTAVVLETAMPSMVLGIVFCDRYKLDSNLYAMTVTLTTVLSLATLPLWFEWLT